MRSKALYILTILLLTLEAATTAQAQGPAIPTGADQPKSKIKILGNVFGGGDQAAVKGNASVVINKGQYAGNIFGGGNGALYDGSDGVHAAGTVKNSADIGTHNDDGTLVEGTGLTSVTINGGEVIYDDDHPSGHNIYGGGNLACNVAGSTDVKMNAGMVTWYTFLSNQEAVIPAWYQWYDQAMNPNTQKTPIVSVFGAGYGAHTDVANNTNVSINISGSNEIKPQNGTDFTHAELEEIDKIIMRWLPDHRLVGQFVSAVHGGGYDGTVGAYDASTYASDHSSGGINYEKSDYTSQTNINIQGQPFIFNVYGGGLGSKDGADANGNVNSHVGSVYGGTRVNIGGGIISGDVFGGGAGIAGQKEIQNPIGSIPATINFPYTFAAQVYRETDVTISGESTVIFGNVYGGGDIANTGWYTEEALPVFDGHRLQQNKSLALLDYTTSLHLDGGNILGKVFGGGNGRTKQDIEQYKFIGSIIGSTNVCINGTRIWSDVYGGGNTGCVYSCKAIAETKGESSRPLATKTIGEQTFTVVDGCTNVAVLDGLLACDIFGGGFGYAPTGNSADASSADVFGNTYLYFEHGDLEFHKYWAPRTAATQETMGDWGKDEPTGQFLDQNSDLTHRNTESDITHNLYGGGNIACSIKGNSHIYMVSAPSVPESFTTSPHYSNLIANVAKPHLSVFGGGFGLNAIIEGNAFSDINLESGAGLHSIIGGGMNGTVRGRCLVHVGSDPASLIHHVYGGGYYAPCGGTKLDITRGNIVENVFGGSVMGNIDAENTDPNKVVTQTFIGLQTEGDGRHSAVILDDENHVEIRRYTYDDHKNQITIGGNVYGANDVSGTVNGVAQLNIYGGTFKGDVFGAGNGDHIGYYVPDELLYDLGAHQADNYFPVIHNEQGAPNGNTYVGRPQTIGGVELTLEGNTKDERITVFGQVFGGGNSCTVGAWNKELLTTTYSSNPHLVRDDPAYFLGGGKIDVTLGSHVRIGRTHAELEAAGSEGQNYLIEDENVSGLYMGCSGRHLATQDWSKTNNYYHHYYDASTAQYWPGFAVYKEGSTSELLNRTDGLKAFRAYMTNILVWTNDVHLNIPDDVDDLWLANFVGGGFRGSMKVKDNHGEFRYTLPRGVTIGHNVIGGAYNTDVTYKIFETSDGHTYTEEDGHYKYLTDKGSLKNYEENGENGDYHHIEYAADGTTVSGIARFYYNGGMLSEFAYDHDSATNDRINRILKEYTAAATGVTGLTVTNDVNKDFAGDHAGADVAFNKYKEGALVYLDLNNKFETEYVHGHVHGGNVFGGCFESGRVEGDIWTDYRCYQEGEQARAEDFNLSDKNFAQAKDFENNFSMMLFGAGYGKYTTIQGSAYVRVLHQEANPLSYIPGAAIGYPRLYNVFGGSYEGKVEGNTNVYFNPGKYGYVTGAIYGGGCNGYVAGKTYLELAGGYIDEAYGGARNANVGGGTHIWTYDGSARWWGEDVVHADGHDFVETEAEKAPLFIGKLYGGTDISGKICTDENGSYTKTKGYQPYYTAEFWPKELTSDGTYNANDITNQTYVDTYLQVGGIEQSDHGYPIIGAIYAAGNGENTQAFFDAKYAQTNMDKDQYDASKLPDQHSTLLEVSDGNIVYAFGGGNHATVTEQNYILVRSFLNSKHDIEGLGGTMYNVMKQRVLNVGVDCYDEKRVDEQNILSLKNASIQRLFGGNNIATMDIQPKWALKSGRINNVYSGGNMGDMTYFNEAGKPATEDGTTTSKAGAHADDGSNSNYTPLGLSITIEYPEIHIGSLYGGCRLSDVVPGGYAQDSEGNYILTNGHKTPAKADVFAQCEDYYGATVNITDGYIENVYGGNDISGTVHFGTNVNISGAVSGNVYGSGNGFYLYKYDTDDTVITEHLLTDYDPEAKEKGLCYTVPGTAEANDTQKLLTINAARPSVEKAFLNIAGLEHYPAGAGNPKRVAYVKGNVFCGGNASTIIGDGSFTKFKIGSYVTLNGVFMGSDGLAYTQNDEIKRFAHYNGITDMGAATDASAFASADEAHHNPILLNVYMMAVDMKSQPKDFNLNLPLQEAHIGTYCGGGNRGSMLIDRTVTLPFHHDIIIYDKIVGACLDANVKYNQDGTIITSYGGYTRKVQNPESNVIDGVNYGSTKMKLDIASQFVPLVMDVPANKLPDTTNEHGETFVQAQTHDFLYDNRTIGVKYTYEEFNELFETNYETQAEFEAGEGEEHQWKVADGIYAPSCNIYGGCYQSGEVEGDIILNLHSNMLRYVNKNDLNKSLDKNIACFNVYGAGFGQDSHVWGNVKIVMDRSLDTSTMGTIGSSTVSPELATMLGTSAKWDIQNQAYVATPTGLDCSYPSFNNIIGGGRNGKLIGNATVEIRNGLVYSDVAGGCYASDLYGSTHVIVGYPQYWRCTATGEYTLDRGDKWNTQKKDFYGNSVIKSKVKYLAGDLIPNNVYEQITDVGKTSNFDDATQTPTNWNDVFIKVGKGVYGGGYSLANSTAASAGSITTHVLSPADDAFTLAERPVNFDDRYGYSAPTAGYGGNSSIMIGDMDATANPGKTDRDHIRISTLKAAKVTNRVGSVIGKFVLNDGKYTHQGDGPYVDGTDYYTLSGDGGIYGDGHLTFCEGFRSADVTRYGYAEGTPEHPVLMNTFQRMDLLNVNDCCLMLQGAQDFATDQIDATVYSITRINEMRLNSSLDPSTKFGEISSQTSIGGAGPDFDHKHQRNYLAFFNNVHYLGAIVTNDNFDDTEHTFHEKDGTHGSQSYKSKKQDFIDAYNSPSALDAEGKKTTVATETFKQRNVGTARNAIGINNGYCLRIQNQEYDVNHQSKQYYGPIVGVCEVKLLTLVQGEGGGYVYADNIHEAYNGSGENDHFLMTSGNFVFPGIVNNDPEIGNQYIVDDCFLEHYGTPANLTHKQRGAGQELDEAHYWYVEGNKYFFNTTLTGFTYQKDLVFNLTKTDPNIILSGLEQGSSLNVKKIEWVSAEPSHHRNNYEAVLPNTTPDKINDYEFDIEIGGIDQGDQGDWHFDMPRYTAGSTDPLHPESYLTTDGTIKNDHLPQLNIRLDDKLDNSGDAAYENHLDEPELVKIYLEGETNGQKYDYTITVNIIYLQGPTFTGGVKIKNCALPGELIGFSSDGLKVKTPELMPITAAAWKVLPLKRINADGTWEWDIDNGIVIPESRYSENLDGDIEGTIRALYKHNECNIAYIFTAGGYDFPVMPAQKVLYANNAEYNAAKGTSLTPSEFNALTDAQRLKSIPEKEERMIVVHNYHRMKDVVPQDLQIETMPSTIPDIQTGHNHPALAEAKLYIEDETDLRAFVTYLNMATATYVDEGGITQEGNADRIPVGLAGLDFILQRDITLTQPLPAIDVPFAGNFHGDGYHIDLAGQSTSFLGDKLAGKVYNLGLIGGTISSVETKAANGLVDGTHTINSYEYTAHDDLAYGRLAYDLSHHFAPTAAGYVEGRYANGDYQYATTDRVWSLRTAAPNYGNTDTKHNMAHTHDAARWNDVSAVNVPLHSGTSSVADRTANSGGEIVTYRGLSAGYANDYLFFGQHLDLTDADPYPMHIEHVATGDADATKGGNRVYQTSGFYRSADDQKFHYNRDAWAIQPALTAIDFTFVGVTANDLFGYTPEPDGAPTTPLAFHVDSNADYNADGTRRTTTDPYDHLACDHVSQNLLVYREADAAHEPLYTGTDAQLDAIYAEGIYPDHTPESSIRYHLLYNKIQEGAGGSDQRSGAYTTDYFHLVDCQDFFAPTEFFADRRAWYERLPHAFRTVDAGYGSATAWEGLCLPFAFVTRVYGEAEGNNLSHFYGQPTSAMKLNPALNDRTLHHEYWLAALVGAQGSEATFARPSFDAESSDLFTDGKQYYWTAYEFTNTYYNGLPNYSSPDGDYYGTRNDDNWYAAPHTFTAYPHITTAIPYLVAFPGESFYEFDLTGQVITFEFVSPRLDDDGPMYPIFATGSTDGDYSHVLGHPDLTTTVGPHAHVGTYLHVPADAQHLGVNAAGTAFEVTPGHILPFRTYMTTTASPSAHRIIIRDAADEAIDGHAPDTPRPDDDLGDATEPTLIVYAEGSTIVTESNFDTRLRVYSSAGRLVKTLDVPIGTSRHLGFLPDVYVVAGKKLRVM